MRDTHTHRQRHRQREKQAPCREPDAGLHPGILGSWPEPEADAQPLSSPGVPMKVILMATYHHLECMCCRSSSHHCRVKHLCFPSSLLSSWHCSICDNGHVRPAHARSVKLLELEPGSHSCHRSPTLYLLMFLDSSSSRSKPKVSLWCFCVF